MSTKKTDSQIIQERRAKVERILALQEEKKRLAGKRALARSLNAFGRSMVQAVGPEPRLLELLERGKKAIEES